MQFNKTDRMVAGGLVVGGILAALFFVGLFTESFGIFGTERAPDMETVQPTN
jgi:hypothetical protein